MNSIQKNKLYYPQLDAIRGLSFLAVFFYHAYSPNSLNGFALFLFHKLDLSIDVFFTLSSFLITWLGLAEIKSKGNFSFKNYFIRRALRIWPLYYILLLFSFIILPLAASYLGIKITLPPATYYIFFIANFYNEGQVYFLQFLWTLSVEEQFYILWGLCLWGLKQHLILCLLLLMLISIVFNIYAINTYKAHYFNTLTYLFDFGIGALSATLLFNQFEKCKNLFTNKSFISILLFYISPWILFLISYLATSQNTGITNDYINLLVRYLFILFIALLIVEQMTNAKTLVKLNKAKFLIYTGKISYGLYCFHGIVLTFGGYVLQKNNVTLFTLTTALLFLVITYCLSSISYYFIEKPFLKLKDGHRRI